MDETTETSAAGRIIELIEAAGEQLRALLHTHPGRIDVAPPEACRIVAELYTIASHLGTLTERLERGLDGWERPSLHLSSGAVAEDAGHVVGDAQVALLQAWHGLSKAYRDLTSAQNLLADVWLEEA